jgi:beta-lactamase regulating signal transducer with metallopeptidase domain
MLADFIGRYSSLQTALPVLLDAALKGALLVVIAAIAAYLLRHRSAASRHAVWSAAVIGHLMIPALVLVLPAWRLPVLPAAEWMQSSPAIAPVQGKPAADKRGIQSSGPSVTRAPSPASEAPSASNPGTGIVGRISASPSSPAPSVEAARAPLSAIQVLAALWLAGSLVVLLRLAVGTWQVGRLAREGARVEDGVWLSLVQRLANRLGVTRPLILLRGERLAVPVTWGIVYPAVLLPQDADTWSEERRRFVLVHEMAHVKRFDALTQLLAQLSLAVFWFDPLVWVAAQRMRVEREHACDDYVIRDGTTPSLYAGELLEMVQSIGTRRHDHAAPAFAALAMARRSEFEGRMLAILDPRLDRHTLNRRGTFMTAMIVALLTLPLAAWRPFQQPSVKADPAVQATVKGDEFPSSFKVTFGDPAPAATLTTKAWATQWPTQRSAWSCDSYVSGRTGTHISLSDDNGSSPIMQYLASTTTRCAEASIVGRIKFSTDEKRITELAPGGFARFRERTGGMDRSVSVTSTGDGSLSYTAVIDGRTVPFDSGLQGWLGGFLPEIVREAGINVPERVARIRAQGGVPAVLREVSQIHSTATKRAYYEELLKAAPLSGSDADNVAAQVSRDLSASSGDLSSVLQQLPRSALQSAGARDGIKYALSHIASSGDKATTLEIMAPNADPELLLILIKAAEDVQSSGDKANFLTTTAAEYLTHRNETLRNAYFHTVATIPSSGDMANVLVSAVRYGYGDPEIAPLVIETSKGLASSGDVAFVLTAIIDKHLLQQSTPRVVLSFINRTLTMASSGDRANVLMYLANANILSTRELRDAFTKAAMALPSEGDRANVLAAAASH